MALGGFGCMENTPTGRDSDLPTHLEISPNDSKSRSVNNSLRRLDVDTNSMKDFCLPGKAPP